MKNATFATTNLGADITTAPTAAQEWTVNDMRLIDADKLERHEADTYGAIEDVVYAEDIDKAPTIDAVPVVRCKDCKHYRYSRWCMRRARCGEEHMMRADDFCSYGERKDGDGNG